MAQRHSGYSRIKSDLYVTPDSVYQELYKVEPWAKDAWDCCPINADFDFTEIAPLWSGPIRIATNPPFSCAEKIIRHAIALALEPASEGSGGSKIAMLLPHAFDAAKRRIDLWSAPFKIKYVLTDRIRWTNLVQKEAGPSMNHAWYVWDTSYNGPAMMRVIGGRGEDKGLAKISTLPKQKRITEVDKAVS
jgi:hypothetical protein